ncbi:acyltransferase domain-containing protein [Kribbella sp. CA-294648]|uniref:acyltransferase domain-containing protein n=1 Tax=Kribbella sp. CA-294648 TaxID=3239948 RepID=UPI003D8D592A
MRDQLRWLDVPEEEHAAIIASMPDPDRTPEQWQALQEVTAALLDDLGTLTSTVNWPADGCPLHAYLAVLPQVREWHAKQGIPEEISRATLAQFGSRVRQGEVTRHHWFTRHIRGSLYRLGRLQFDRAEPVLEVHIPGDGPLTPAACDESFAAAKPFFAKHFPEEHYDRATCSSWLLDPQLADYLPVDSNILRFQRRFTLLSRGEPGDDEIVEFIFGTGAGPNLPRQTTLQRAIADHLAAGNHWYHVLGSVELP